MKTLNKMMKFMALLLIVLIQFIFVPTSQKAYAATTRIDLGTADNFAILGGAAVTGTGTNVVTGNVGLSPNGGTAITALTCAEVTGTIYDTDAGYTGGGGVGFACLSTNPGLLTTAKSDLSTAYTDAAGRTAAPDIATDLGGVTLTDGVYHAASGTFEITGGKTLTLDGGGNADAVFIFKMASTLVTSTSSKVVLTGSAQACNVYWQVGSSATLGNSSTLVGNVLAFTSITANTGSTVDGRLLAASTTNINGAVTILDGTTITKKTCAAGTAGAPTSTPTPTPTPTSSPNSSTVLTNDTTSVPALPYCPPFNYVAPIIIGSRRVDADSIFVSWGPYSGINTFIVEYGPENGKWLYNTRVTGFSTTLNALPLNQPIWVRITATDYCSEGVYGEAKLVGGPSLPNTGFTPHENNILWYIPVSIFVLRSFLLKLILI